MTAQNILSGPDSIFKTFFAPVAQTHPELAETILNDAMNLAENGRRPAQQLAPKARGLLSSDTQLRDEFIASLRSLEDPAKVQEDYDRALAYSEWEAQKSAAAAAREQNARGVARNVPG